MCDRTSSYATAGIALRVSGALKPHHHDKAETPSMGDLYNHSPIHLHGVVLSEAQGQLYLTVIIFYKEYQL
jgi:hypothetical protein